MRGRDDSLTIIVDGHSIYGHCDKYSLDVTCLNVGEVVKAHLERRHVPQELSLILKWRQTRDGRRYYYRHNAGKTSDGAKLVRTETSPGQVTYEVTTSPLLRPLDLGNARPTRSKRVAASMEVT